MLLLMMIMVFFEPLSACVHAYVYVHAQRHAYVCGYMWKEGARIPIHVYLPSLAALNCTTRVCTTVDGEEAKDAPGGAAHTRARVALNADAAPAHVSRASSRFSPFQCLELYSLCSPAHPLAPCCCMLLCVWCAVVCRCVPIPRAEGDAHGERRSGGGRHAGRRTVHTTGAPASGMPWDGQRTWTWHTTSATTGYRTSDINTSHHITSQVHSMSHSLPASIHAMPFHSIASPAMPRHVTYLWPHLVTGDMASLAGVTETWDDR